MEDEDDARTPPDRSVEPAAEAEAGRSEPEARWPFAVARWFGVPPQWFSNRRPPKRTDRSK